MGRPLESRSCVLKTVWPRLYIGSNCVSVSERAFLGGTALLPRAQWAQERCSCLEMVLRFVVTEPCAGGPWLRVNGW